MTGKGQRMTWRAAARRIEESILSPAAVGLTIPESALFWIDSVQSGSVRIRPAFIRLTAERYGKNQRGIID